MNKKEYSAIVVVVCLFLMAVMITGVAIKHALELKPDHSVHAVSENVSQEDRDEYVAPVPAADTASPADPVPAAEPHVPNTPKPYSPEPSAPDEYIAPAPPEPVPAADIASPADPVPSDERPQLLPEGGCTPILDL